MNSFKSKLTKTFSKVKTAVTTYVRTNIMFLTYVAVCLFNSTLLRYFTTESFWNIKPFLADIAVLILIGSSPFFAN